MPDRGTLDPGTLAALLSGSARDLFALLGWHSQPHGLVLRCFLPGAATVAVIRSDQPKAPPQSMHCLDHGGVFERMFPGLEKRFDYQLEVAWQDGNHGVYHDPYAFGPVLSDSELAAFHEGHHLRPYLCLGAHPCQQQGVSGVRFALWAPNASRVSVIGAFNHWDGRRHVMRLRHRAGVYEIFIPGLEGGELYKFELLDQRGQRLPLKADPYAFASELRPGTASRVHMLPSTASRPATRALANRRDAPIAIYELHAASWCQGANGAFPSWHELSERVPAYVAELGFTHIELMPISEHPLDASWGYQTLGMFAPSARFGPPEGFSAFVAACHAKGLGVLLDWVPAHFPADEHGLARFDGSALYEYADPREGFHRDWNTLIYNFGRTEVASFLRASALFWLERYGVDGLRVDAVASMLYRDYSRAEGEWLPNHLGGRENLEAIALLRAINEAVGQEQPGTMTVAEESTAFPQVSAPTYAGGLGFHYKWNMGWMNDTLKYISADPIHRRWHHDQLTFGLVYAFSENYVLPISHDEVVHGKGSMLGKMPGDAWQKFANLRAYYGFMWGHPGKKLLFMGQEFAQPGEWQHDHALPWHLLEHAEHRGMQRWIRDLNHCYRSHSALYQRDCEASGFQWLIADDREQSVLAWARFDHAGSHALIVCNFTPEPRWDYRVPVPHNHHPRYRLLLNSDARCYGGSGVAESDLDYAVQQEGEHGHLRLLLPPLSALFLVPA